MRDKKIRRLPVAEDSGLKGMVTERDLIFWLLDNPEIILHLLSETSPAVVRDVVVSLLTELKLRSKV